MKKTLLIAALIFFVNSLLAQIPTWERAERFGGYYDDTPVKIRTDRHGNVYSAGNFKSPAIIFGNVTLTKAGSTDIFIVKYDHSGNVIWAKSIGGIADDILTDMDIDSAGNVYITGYYQYQAMHFGPFLLPTPVVTDMFIGKLDSSGNILWGKAIGGDYYDNSNSITVDNKGSFYLSGSFNSSTLSFGPNVSVSSINTWGNYFLARFDASGNALWARSSHSDMGSAVASSVVVDSAGKVYVAGFFDGLSLSFGNYTFTNPNYGVETIFLARFDTLGNNVWAKSYYRGYGNREDVYLKTIDKQSFYMTGSASYGLNFGGGNTLPSGTFVFLANLDTSGNAIWAGGSAGGGVTAVHGITTDKYGAAYITGEFCWPNLRFGTDTLFNTNAFAMSVGSCPDIFLVKYDRLGNVRWAKNNKFNGFSSGTERGITVAVDSNLAVYNSGTFLNGLILDTFNLVNAGAGAAYDIYLAEIKQCKLSPPSISLSTDTLSTTSSANYYQWYLNGSLIVGASSPYYKATNSGNYTLRITDTLGCEAYSSAYSYTGLGITGIHSSHSVNIYPNPSSGVFQIETSGAEGEITILNALGQKVYSSVVTNSKTTINIKQNGLYTIYVHNTSKYLVYKMIIIN